MQVLVTGDGLVNNIDRRTKLFLGELRQLMEWEEHEMQKVISRLEAEGKVLGLDGHVKDFLPIRRERAHRLKNLFEEYKDLPPGTKLKLW